MPDGPGVGPGDDRAELTACDVPARLGVDQSSLESVAVTNLDDGPGVGPGDDRAELTTCDVPERLGVDQSSLESAGVANLDDEGGPDHCLVAVGVLKGEDDRELEPDNASEGKGSIEEGEKPGLLEAALVLRDADPKAVEAVRRLTGVRGKDNLQAM